VVAKLLAGIQPDCSFFGRKDAQQLAIVRRMAADLSFASEIIGVPIVREADGLALSSRNIFLSDAERQSALALSSGLLRAADLVEGGERDAGTMIGAVLAEIAAAPGLSVEYVTLAGQDTVQPLDRLSRSAFLALAAWSGKTRLIDNIHLDKSTDGYLADRGNRLAVTSVLYAKSGPGGEED
jgi:pantoate--beta-alanine ligase